MVTVKEYEAPPINRREIARYAGITSAVSELDGLIDECLNEALSGLCYRVCYAELPIVTDGEYLDMGGIRTSSEDLKKCLSGCHRAIVFAATVGLYPDRLIKKYARLSPSRALVISAAGSERVESLCNAFCRELKEKYGVLGLSVTPRFSAGYGDLPLALQRDIFKLLGCERNIGITLSESLLMTPTKSVTAIMGIK